MENKKINVLFYLVLILFLVVFFILIRDFNARRVSDYKYYIGSVSNIVREKNDKIRVLFNLLVAKEKENEDLKNTLAETRNGLDALSKRLAQPAPVAPVAAPATAVK